MPGVNPISSGGPSSAAANDSETTALLHEASTSGTLDVHNLATEVSKLTPAQQKAVTGELQGRLSPMQLGQFARLQGEAASHAAFTSKQGASNRSRL